MATPADTFARNLSRLLSLSGMSARALSKQAGVSDRMIGMYLQKDSVASIENVEKIAQVFGFAGWELLMPDFDPEVMQSNRFRDLCRTYVRSDKAARQAIDAQVTYIAHRQSPPGNDPTNRNEEEPTGS